MGELIQYDFFERREDTEAEYYKKKVEDLEALIHRVRKGNYAKLGNHEKRLQELEHILPVVMKGLCNGR